MDTTTTKTMVIKVTHKESRLITLVARMTPTGMETLLLVITIDLCLKANNSQTMEEVVAMTSPSKIHNLMGHRLLNHLNLNLPTKPLHSVHEI